MKKQTSVGVLLLLIGCVSIPDYSALENMPEIRYHYNEITGEGQYITNPVHHFNQDIYYIQSIPSIRCNDPLECKPKYVTLYIHSNSSMWLTEGGARLNFLADNQRFQYEDSNPSFSAAQRSRFEGAAFIIPIDEFQTIAESDSVRGEFNGLELDFTRQNRSMYRSILQALHERDQEKYYFEVPEV